MSSSEETLFKAADNICTMADLMHLGRTIVDRANQLFQQVHSGQHLKGHSTDAIAATCLHLACRWVENI
jgi:transcription initiation factor TFIIB